MVASGVQSLLIQSLTLMSRRGEHTLARKRGHRSVSIVRQAADIWRLKVYSYGRLSFVTVCHSITHAPVIREQL